MIRFCLSKKIMTGLVLLTVLLCIMSSVITTVLYRHRMETYYSDSAFKLAKLAARSLDGSPIEQYVKTLETDSRYDQISSFLWEIRETTGAKSLSVVLPKEDAVFCLWDTGISGDHGVSRLGDEEAYDDWSRPSMQAAFQKPFDKQNILITNHKDYGYLASSYVPVLNEEGRVAAIVSVDISIDNINQEIRQFNIIFLMLAILILLIFMVLYYLFLKWQVIGPIKKLHLAAAMVRENLESASDTKIVIQTGDEIEDLAEAYNDMIIELREYIASLSRITAKKEKAGAELNVAGEIQASQLPCISPAFPGRSEFDLYAVMRPAREAGCDFYDFFMIGEDHLGVVIADVPGKGVPAALLMVIAKTLIKNRAQTGEEPGDIFTGVNQQLRHNSGAGLPVTAWMGILEVSSGQLTYANAGHNPPFLRQGEDSFSWLKGGPESALNGTAAGMDDIHYQQWQLKLNPSDMLFLYTDGVTGAADIYQEQYGEERLLGELNRLKEKPLKDILGGIKKDIDFFAMGADQMDDITMLVLKINDPFYPPL